MGRASAGKPEYPGVPPDLAEMLVRRSAGRMAAAQPRCAACRRTPLSGELLRVFASGRKMCALCAGAAAGEPLALERAGPRPRHVVVTPRAA